MILNDMNSQKHTQLLQKSEMNRFWGRNDEGSSQKFTRDDDQILALNYENLCDMDYVNRLFLSDEINDSSQDADFMTESGDPQIGNSQMASSIFSSELSEDLMIFGDSAELSKLCFDRRFSKEISLTGKYQDSITNLFNKQIIVFEHVGRIMVDRCSQPVPPDKDDAATKLENTEQFASATALKFEVGRHLISDSLPSALAILQQKLSCIKAEGRVLTNFKKTTIEGLLAMVFIICDESATNSLRFGSVHSVATWDFNPMLLINLRNMLTSCIHSSLTFSVNRDQNVSIYSSSQLVEENLKLAFSCFYGLLLLGFQSRNSSDLILATYYLLCILLQAEEWQETFSRECKAAVITQSNNSQSHVNSPRTIAVASSSNTSSNATPIRVNTPSRTGTSPPIVNQDLRATSNISNKVHMKQLRDGNANNHHHNNSNQGRNGSGMNGGNNTANNTKPPHKPALPSSISNHSKRAASPGPKIAPTRPADELRNDNFDNSALNKIDLIPSLVVGDANGKSTNKTWEKTSAKTDKEFSKNKIPVGKSFKVDVDQIAGNHSVIVNHVIVNYNSQHPNRTQQAGNGKSINNNQASEVSQQPGSSKSSHKQQSVSKNGSTNNQQTAASATKACRDPADKVRQEIREFNDMLQSNLKIPKSILKVLNDSCMIISNSLPSLKATAGSFNTRPNGATTAPAVASNPPAVGSKPTGTTSVGGKESMYTWKSSVWSCGQNSYGELGLGDVNLRKNFAKVPSLEEKSIVSIGAGNEHSLFVTKDGRLYTSGYNDNGQCGVGSTQQVRQPTLVQSLEGEDIAQVNVYNGCEHTLAITRDGKIFSFGYNYRGQLGLGSTSSESIPRPIRGLLSRKVVLAACSYHHSFMLCSDGSLFSCGRNDCGQLGHGDTIDKKTPQSVMNCPRNIASISCGQFHTVAATSAGVAFVCGKNDYGQLSLESASNVKVFTKAPFSSDIENIVQVCCGYYHTLVLSSTGIIAGFGRNDYGQLGLGHSQPKVYQSTIINSLRDKGVTMISAGCYHSVVVTANGMLYVFGRNNHGQLATGDLEERHSPHPVDDFVGQRILSVAAGFYHTLILSVDSSTPASQGWDDGFILPFAPTKAASLFGSSVTNSLSGNNIADEGAHAHNDLRSGFYSTAGGSNGRESSLSALNSLLKDAAIFTFMNQSSQQLSIRQKSAPKFSYDSKSKISTRELFVFLTNHIETLILYDNQTAGIETFSNDESLLCLKDVFSSIVTMLEIARRTIEDCPQSNSKLPISQDDALNFFHRMIRITSSLLKKHKSVIMGCIESLRTCNDESNDVYDANSLHDLSLVALLELQEADNFEHKSVSHLMMKSKKLGTVSSEPGERKQIQVCKGFYLFISKLRFTLLSAYLSIRVDEDRKSKSLEVLSDIGTVLAKFGKIFFPTSDLYARYFDALQKNVLSSLKGTNSTKSLPPEIIRSFYTLNLRLLALSGNLFKNNEEVVRIFQRSTFDGLRLFRVLLSIYSHFSRLLLEKKIQQQSGIPTTTPLLLVGAALATTSPVLGADVRRLMSLLEHCITNFLKCAVPIIFSNTLTESQISNPSLIEYTPLSRKLHAFGVEVIREVLCGAEAVIDYLLLPQQPLSDDVMNQLRYGTVMPSILPSILIYGMSFAKNGYVMMDIMPNMRTLIKKLQQLGKTDINAGNAGNSAISPMKSAVVAEKTKPSSTANSKEDEATTENSFEDMQLGPGKKDSIQVSWWFRLLKLSVNFSAIMASKLTSLSDKPTKSFQQNAQKPMSEDVAPEQPQQDAAAGVPNNTNYAKLRIWNFISLRAGLSADIHLLLQEPEGEVRPVPDSIEQICLSFREEEKRADAMYRMLSQSSQGMHSSSIFYEIEKSILEVIVFLCGYQNTVSDRRIYSSAFKLLSRMIKHVHSKRSVLISNSSELSWVEILLRICRVIKTLCKVLLQGEVKIAVNVPLILPLKSMFIKNTRAYYSLRRAMMVVLCVSRWRNCVKYKMKDIASSVVDFLSSACSTVTNEYTTVDTTICTLSTRQILESLVFSNHTISRYSSGVDSICLLLEDVSSVSLKCDILCALIPNLKAATKRAIDKSYRTSSMCCEAVVEHNIRQSDERLVELFVKVLNSVVSGSSQFTQYELQFLTNVIRLVQILEDRRLHLYGSSCSFPSLAVSTVQGLVILLNEKQKKYAVVPEDKAAKKMVNLRERNAAFHRASNSLVSYLQSIAIVECNDCILARPNLFSQLYRTISALISHIQLHRLDIMREDSILEDVSSSLKATCDTKDGSNKNGSNSKDSNKKRCQDLINKPMEFCKNVEGIVVQGDKLINNYKGVDFSIATWVIVAKKSISTGGKQSFITGKLNHNDAWPLVVLRGDGKLDILFGHNSEFEKLTTEAVIPHFVWTHIAIVVEQKKIKVFINGAVDCQANATKGNGRAVMFPLIIGSCPQEFRTRVSCVREGFDGLLAQYKYYSRALSPIHVKVIFDHGPPETADNCERLVYRMLSSLKLITKSLNSTVAGHENPFVTESLQDAAAVMHMVFMTDMGRRTRFAALDVLGHVLTAGCISDLQLSCRPHPVAFSVESVSLNESKFAFCNEEELSLRERVVYYLVRLIGMSFAPHLHPSLSSFDSMSSTETVCGDNFFNFVKVIPTIIAYKDGVMSGQDSLSGSQPSNSNNGSEEHHNLLHTSVDKVVSKESLMMETCNHIVRVLCKMSLSRGWNESISSVLNRILDDYMQPNRDPIGEMSAVQRIDLIGASVFLGGGSEGKYLGVRVQNFFGAADSIILNSNNTTNYATILCWNMNGSTQQISRVRLGDVTAVASSLQGNEDNCVDRLSLSAGHNRLLVKDLLPRMISLVDDLAQFTPLLLNDFLCILQPDHPYQCKTLLRSLRPVELLIFSQFVKTIAAIRPDILVEIGTPLITKDNGAFSMIIQQAASSTLSIPNLSASSNSITYGGGAQSCVNSCGVYSANSGIVPVDDVEENGLYSLWMKCSKYVLSLPEKLGNFPLITNAENEKILYDFVSQCYGIAVEPLLNTPFEALLRRGRLSELIHCLAVGAASATGSTLTVDPNNTLYDDKYLMSDWSLGVPSGVEKDQSNRVSSFYNYLSATGYNLITTTDSEQNQQEATNALQLVFRLRESIVRHSRKLLQLNEFLSDIGSLEKKESSWNILVWESTLPLSISLNSSSSLPLLYGFYDEVCSRIRLYGNTSFTTDSVWRKIASVFRLKTRVEVTQSMASTLRYSALSLLQTSSIKSTGNVLEAADLFKKIAQSMFHWIDFNKGQPGEAELYYHVLKIVLPSLSFIDSSVVELQLMQICTYTIRKLVLCMFDGYKPSKDLLDLAKSNNFTLLRARAQEQVFKFKCHSMGSISPLAYNLTQIVAGLEILQRYGCNFESNKFMDTIAAASSSSTSAVPVSARGPAAEVRFISPRKMTTSFTSKLSTKESAPPKIIGIRSTSIDADLNNCALSAVRAISSELIGMDNPSHDWKDAEALLTSLYNADTSMIMVEVAMASATSAPLNYGSDLHYETVYFGTSFRFVQSGLVPDCTYYLRCRAYCGGGNPMEWSKPEEFRTEAGTLFSFDPMKCGPDILLNEEALVASYAGDDTWSTLLGNKSFCSGVTSWEIRINQSSTAYVFIGVATSAADLHTFLGGCGSGWGFIGEQALYHNREKVKIYGESFSSGDVMGVTLDLNAGTLSFSKNKKNLGVAFDKLYGELFPAVAFYNIGQEIEILADGFKTTCPQEGIPVSPCRLNLDELSLLNELVLNIYHRQPLSHRLTHMLVDQCNQWSAASFVRYRAVSGKDVFLSKESPLLKKFGFTVGERVRTPYGVAEVAGAAYHRLWFRIGGSTNGVVKPSTSPNSEDSKVWYFSPQQIADGRSKKLFLRCSYASNNSSNGGEQDSLPAAGTAALQFDYESISDLVDPSKWSEDMDHLLLNFLVSQSDGRQCSNSEAVWKVTADQVCENFRPLQQQLSRLAMNNHELSHKWGISGPKRKAVLARMGLLRMFNQLLEMYLPFLVTDSANSGYLPDSKASEADDFTPLQVSIPTSTINSPLRSLLIVRRSVITAGPVMKFSWEGTSAEQRQNLESEAVNAVDSQELFIGPIHAVRRRVFQHTKLAHFLEVLRCSVTKPAKTEDDYDYPDDLAHVKINRIRAFRAREAAELMHIPGEDLLLQSMFCQLWRELRQYASDKLRISYTHPMDDGQSRTFKVKFDGEGVDDYGGPYREIFQQICEELQISDPGVTNGGGTAKRPSSWESNGTSSIGDSVPIRCFLPLLLPTPNWTASGDCKERYKYTFHPASTSPLHMELFRFLGQFMGIAIRSKITLDISLSSFLWKCVVNERLTEEDLRSFDEPAYQFVNRLRYLHEKVRTAASSSTDGSDLEYGEDIQLIRAELEELLGDLTWTAKLSDGGVVELVEGGSKLLVKHEDLLEYLSLYTHSRLTESSSAVDMFKSGLASIIPESSLTLLSWEEFEDFVCGQRTIDVQRLRENTEYDDDLSPDDQHIQFFWDVLASEFSEMEKSAFLRFVWARPTLPPVGVEFSQKLRILSAVGDDAALKPDQYLPKAHTCFFSINLPKYSTRELMAAKLRYAIFNCTEMDADFRTTEAEVAGWGGATSSAGAGSFAAQAEWHADSDLAY